MKILHTSDWHLGHTLYNYDRTEEQSFMLEQMERIVAEEKPDVFLLCGDVYHTSQPSAAIQTLLTEALVRIHNAHPKMAIVMTAGNHDSGTRHEIFRTPWRALNVYAIGNLEKEHPEEHIIEVAGKGFVIALPYINEHHMPEGLFQQLTELAVKQNTGQLPVVLAAHTTVRGCDYTGHDHATEYTVGGIDSYDLDEMGQGYDYLALGHIHHGQFVQGGGHRVRYCGSPLPVSFDECYPHSVTIVEIDTHGTQPRTRTIEIENVHPLVTLPATNTASWDEAKELLKAFPNEIAAYIRLNVETEDLLPPEANTEAAALSKGKACRFCYINAVRKNQGLATSGTLTVQEFQAEKPVSIARRYADDLGLAFDEEMEALFDEAVKMSAHDADK